MIYDKIDNIDTYAGLYEDIIIGLKFLREIQPDIQIGVYNLSSTVKAIVARLPGVLFRLSSIIMDWQRKSRKPL